MLREALDDSGRFRIHPGRLADRDSEPRTVEEILTGSSAEADIIPNGLQNTHHQFIHIVRVKRAFQNSRSENIDTALDASAVR